MTLEEQQHKPKPDSPSELVNWDWICKSINFIAKDEDGSIWGFSFKPAAFHFSFGGEWDSDEECYGILEIPAIQEILKDVDWKESLLVRPGYIGDELL